MKPGEIKNPMQYLQSKLLDDSDWQKGKRVLPRGGTGSDIDRVWDNNGSVIFAELSHNRSGIMEWSDVDYGQKLAYENVIRGNRKHCAVICTHAIDAPSTLKDIQVGNGVVSTRRDIYAFQVMMWHRHYAFNIAPLIRGNARWQRFMFLWFDDNGPVTIRNAIINNELEETLTERKSCG